MSNNLLFNVPEAINKILENYKVVIVPKDSQPVQLKHGQWVRNDNGTYSCSECYSWIPNEQHYYARYCLFCGARMDEVEDE